MSALLNYGVNTNLNGVNGFGRQAANANGNTIAIYNTQLGATTDKTVTVPKATAMGNYNNTNSKILAILNYQAAATVFVANQTPTNGVTTAAPDTSGTITAGSSMINPTALLVNGGDILHFYPAAEAFISIEFYSIV